MASDKNRCRRVYSNPDDFDEAFTLHLVGQGSCDVDQLYQTLRRSQTPVNLGKSMEQLPQITKAVYAGYLWRSWWIVTPPGGPEAALESRYQCEMLPFASTGQENAAMSPELAKASGACQHPAVWAGRVLANGRQNSPLPKGSRQSELKLAITKPGR